MIDPIVRGQEQKVVEYVNSQVETLKSARKGRETIWLECMEAYLSKFSATWVARAEKDRRSARYMAEIWDSVETATAQLAAIVWPNEEWFKIAPGRLGGTDLADDEDADSVALYLRHQHEHMRLRQEVLKLIKWLVITGNCPWSMVWHVENSVDYPAYAQAMNLWAKQQAAAYKQYEQAMTQHAVISRIAMTKGLPPPPPPMIDEPERPVQPEGIAYEGPRLIVGDPFNFVIDDTANNPITAFRATTIWRTKAYLARMGETDETGYAVYENLHKVRDAEQVRQDDDSQNQALATAFNQQLPPKDCVRLVEAVGDFELPGTDADGSKTLHRSFIATVANNKELLRFEPTHLWSREPHQQLATLISCPGQTYGIGLVENVLGLQDAINVRSNQILDAAAVAINPESKAFDDGVFDPEEAESGPGAVHMVGSMDNLQPLDKNLSGLGLAFSEVAMMTASLQQKTRAASPASNRNYEMSATEVARDTSVAGANLQEIAHAVEENALLPILRMQLQYNQQYMTEDVIFRVVQMSVPSLVNVNPQTVRRKWDLKVIGSLNQMLKEKRIQDLKEFFQLVSGNPTALYDPLTGMPRIDLQYLMKRLYEEIGFTDSDRVFNPPMPEMPMATQGGGDGVQGGPQGGSSGAPADPGFPGVGLPDQVPESVEELGPYLQKAANARMGAV